MDSKTLGAYIDRMERWTDRVFLVGRRGYRSIPWTFRCVREAVRRLSAELAEGGIPGVKVGPGDRIAIHGGSCPEWVVAFFAVLHVRAVAVPLDMQSSPDFLKRVLKKAKPSLVIGEPLPVRTRLPLLPFSRIAELGESPCGLAAGGGERALDGKNIPGGRAARTVRAGTPDPGVRRGVAPEVPFETGGLAGPGHNPAFGNRAGPGDLAEIVFTSGTTSDPKGVMLTHGNILANLEPIAMGIDAHERLVRFLTPFRMLCTVPYSHMFGQAVGIFLPILLGSTVYFTDDTSPAALVRAIKRDRILTLITVPRIMKLLADHVKAVLEAGGRMRSFERRWDRLVKLPYPLRVLFYLDVHRIMGFHFWSFIVGGAPLDHDTHEFWRRLVFSVFQGYGLTEAAPMVTMFNPFRHDRRSVGKLFPGQEARIGPGGEIQIRGANVMAGYYGDPSGTRSSLQDGWLRTGDIGEMDREGHLFIKGRMKDMICTPDGRNVFAEDVEAVLRGVPGVRDASVFGKKEGTGERVHAVLILAPGADAERVVRAANARLLPYQRIRGFSTWPDEDFPRTPTQKVKKSEVMRRLGEESGAGDETGGVLEGLVAGRADPAAKLGTELGLDSLDILDAVARVERKYGVSIDESAVGPETTLAELETLAASAAGWSAAAAASVKTADLGSADFAPRPPAAGGTSAAVRGPTAARRSPEVPASALGGAAELPMPRWARLAPVRAVRRLIMDLALLPALRIPFRVRARFSDEGWVRSGARTPVILAANHTSNLDPVFLLLALPPRLRGKISPAMGLNRFHAFFPRFAAAKPSPRTGAARGLTKALHGTAYALATFLFQTFPFPQGTAYRPSLEYAGELLDRGVSILIFPEGEVNRDRDSGRRVGSFKIGVAKLADLTEAPVLPVGIALERAGGRGALRPRPRVTVSFGSPVHYRGEGYEEFARAVEARVEGLLE